LKFLSLFSGIGGFDRGLEMAGMQCIAQVENNFFCLTQLKRLWPKVTKYTDVKKFCMRTFDCESEDEDGEVYCPRCRDGSQTRLFSECECIGTDQFVDECGYPDLIAAGVPCQPASLIGKRGGAGDDRWLWPDTLRITEQLTPKWCIFENPPAILTLDGGERFKEIINTLSEIGYDAWWDIIPAYAIGAGHRRERLFIIASYADRKGLQGHAGNGAAIGVQEPYRPIASKDLLSRKDATEKWYTQSGIEPVAYGISGRMDLLRAIGNAVVPAVVEVIGRSIMTVETGLRPVSTCNQQHHTLN
jgi:DNA (cytosine-5)-methyltransferase 1